MSDLYTRAVKTCPTCVGSGYPPYEENVTAGSHNEVLRCPDRCDDGWVDVPVAEPNPCPDCRTGYRHKVVTTHDSLTTIMRDCETCNTSMHSGTRPVSWAMIRPGDRVLFGRMEGVVIYLTAEEALVCFDQHGPQVTKPEMIALIVDGDPPEHRAAHPDWWPR